jgi:hypothetical protein
MRDQLVVGLCELHLHISGAVSIILNPQREASGGLEKVNTDSNSSRNNLIRVPDTHKP